MTAPTSRPPTPPGKESVWDYPRPPRVEECARHIRIVFNGVVIADTRRAVRVLETSHPPVYYIPAEDIRMEHVVPITRTTVCEFKGQASYFSVTVGERTAEGAAWSYPQPAPGYERIAGLLAFYASHMDACFVDDERVMAQPGDFYAGWITSEIVGPFKGGPGTWGW